METVRLARELRRHGASLAVTMTDEATKIITPLAVGWATGARSTSVGHPTSWVRGARHRRCGPCDEEHPIQDLLRSYGRSRDDGYHCSIWRRTADHPRTLDARRSLRRPRHTGSADDDEGDGAPCPDLAIRGGKEEATIARGDRQARVSLGQWRRVRAARRGGVLRRDVIEHRPPSG